MAGSIVQGTELDRYVVERILGEGGMATVYGVRHRDLGTPYALKLLKLRVRSLADRLLQEGRIQGALRHPNVVAVTDVLRLDDDIGLVMEYVDGLPLDLLLVNHRLAPEEIDSLALDLFDGIEAAHELELVHRDLKPANVMMAVHRDRLQAKVTDFGLAKAVREELSVGRATRTGAVMGTPTFMAPEQHQDAKSVDGRADLFSLGLILYEVITGQPAIAHEAMPDILRQVTMEDYRPIPELAPNAPDRWTRTVMACLAADRDDRPEDIAAVRALWGAPGRPAAWSDATMAAVRHIQAHAPEPPALPAPIHTTETVVAMDNGPQGTGLSPSPHPEAVPAPLPAESRLSRVGLVASTAALTTVVGGGGVLLVGAAVGAWLFWPTPEPTPPRPDPVAQAPAPAPEPLPSPAPVPAAPTPAPAAPEPAKAAVPTPPRPARPAPQPAPAPLALPPPEPVAEPPPAPVAAPTAPPAVTLNGPWRAYLQAGGQRHELATAPPGSYELWVLFDLQRPTKAGNVTVVAGQTVAMQCDELSTLCRPRP